MLEKPNREELINKEPLKREILDSSRSQIDFILRMQVDLLKNAKKQNKIEEARSINRNFENQLLSQTIEGISSKELYQMRLDEYLTIRDNLLKEYKNLAKEYGELLGFPSADDWYDWVNSLKNSYEKHPQFKNWPILLKASIILGQIDWIKKKIIEAEKLNRSNK